MPNANLVLLLVFVGAFATAAIIPFIGLFIIEGLGKSPMMISAYSLVATSFAVVANRYMGQIIDKGADIRKLLLISILAFLVAMTSLLLFTSYWTLVTIFAACLSLASSSMGTILSLARFYSEQSQIDTSKFNARVRAAMSLSWMIAPALSFAMVGVMGYMSVFKMALGVGVVWLLVWYVTLRQPFRRTESAQTTPSDQTIPEDKSFNFPLWAAALSCFFISLGNALAMSAAPLFMIKEAGLPPIAPGLSLSVKCFAEIVVILGSPALLKWIGTRNSMIFSCLLAVLCYFYLSTITTMTELVLAATIEGIYFGIFAAVSITFMQSFSRGFIGNAMSLYTNGMFLSGLVGGSAMGVIASYLDYRSVILSASLAVIAAAITLVTTRSTDSAAQELPA